jgi:tetratricopeptide (TPR) repeat protein
VSIAALCLALASAALAQTTSKARLDTNETVFSTFAALNACGYDADLADSNPLRAQTRGEIAQNVARSPEAQKAQQRMCTFIQDHKPADPRHAQSQYVSLALELTEPPQFQTIGREADLPPDAAYVLGFVPLLQRFYDTAGLRDVWRRHEKDYDHLVEQFAPQIAKMRFDTDIYLKLASAGYLGRSFTIYVEPLSAPGEANARNYGSDYYLVISPAANGELPMHEIRHTYLHFILDPMALKRANAVKALEPILDDVQSAPMDEAFKYDISLLVTESLIQAIEARTLNGGKAPERAREAAMRAAMAQGYVLTRYFYEGLEGFEKQPTGISNAYGDLLHDLNLSNERKHARETVFAKQGEHEVVGAKRPNKYEKTLDIAEQRLAVGDVATAKKYAQDALDQHSDDPGHAMFILARCAVLTGDPDAATKYFNQTIETSRDPRMQAWSHIYLGRILDMHDERDEAITHYRAALAAGDTNPDTKKAAERGIAEPYQPNVPRQ